MSNSDKEFKEWFKSMSYKHHFDVRKEVWNHLYPYKERCEELAELLHKEEIHRVSDVQMQQLVIQTLEALLIEACEKMEMARRYEPKDAHDGWIKDYLGIFLNKPEIKKLLEGVKGE